MVDQTPCEICPHPEGAHDASGCGDGIIGPVFHECACGVPGDGRALPDVQALLGAYRERAEARAETEVRVAGLHLTIERLIVALSSHLDDDLPCFCARHDAIYPNGSVEHQPRCRLARLALTAPEYSASPVPSALPPLCPTFGCVLPRDHSEPCDRRWNDEPAPVPSALLDLRAPETERLFATELRHWQTTATHEGSGQTFTVMQYLGDAEAFAAALVAAFRANLAEAARPSKEEPARG